MYNSLEVVLKNTFTTIYVQNLCITRLSIVIYVNILFVFFYHISPRNSWIFIIIFPANEPCPHDLEPLAL